MPYGRRTLAATVAIPLLVVALAGCVGGASHGQEIEKAAQTALGNSGHHGGVDTFNTSEGLGDTWDLNICFEASASATPQELARDIADTLNAVRDVATQYSPHLEGVDVRVVDEAINAKDLGNWCRAENSGGLLDLSDAADLLGGVGYQSTGNAVSVTTPYAEISLVAPTATPSPAPTS